MRLQIVADKRSLHAGNLNGASETSLYRIPIISKPPCPDCPDCPDWESIFSRIARVARIGKAFFLHPGNPGKSVCLRLELGDLGSLRLVGVGIQCWTAAPVRRRGDL